MEEKLLNCQIIYKVNGETQTDANLHLLTPGDANDQTHVSKKAFGLNAPL